MILILAVALCALVAAGPLHAQSATSGRRFVFAYPDTLGNRPRRIAQYFAEPTFNDVQWIILFSEDSARVHLKGYRVTLDTVVVPGRSTIIRLDSMQRSFTRWGLEWEWTPDREAFELTADRDVSVTCYYATAYGAEAFVPLPVSRWGTRYYPAMLPGDSVLDVLTYYTQEEDQYITKGAPPRYTVVAAEDGTNVTFFVPDPINGPRTTTVAIDAGRVYDYRGGYSKRVGGRMVEESAGILITANKPIGVLAGNMRSAGTGGIPFAAVTRNSLKNSLVEWVRPITDNGRTFAFRTFADVDGERTGEHVRIVATSPGETMVTTTSGPWSDHRLKQGEAADLLLFAADSFDLRSYEIRASAPVEVIQVSGPWSALGEASRDSGFGPEILTWSPAMTTLLPREQWFSFTRFHVPDYPAQMKHTLTLVADPSSVISLDDVPLVVRERVFGSSLQCITMEVAPGDHVLRSRRGRFSGTVAGRARGHEAFRPMKAQGDGEPPAGAAAAHVATYAENIAVSYAWPLDGMPLPDDSLEASSGHGCDSLLVTVSTAGATPFDGRYGLTITDSSNVTVRRDSLFDGDLHIGWRFVVRPQRRDVDARATIVLIDADGVAQRFDFGYTAMPITIDPPRVELFSVPVGTERETSVAITNRSAAPITIASIDLVDGTASFRLTDAPLRAITIASGALFTVRVTFIGNTFDRQYRDTILLLGDCLEARVPLAVRTTSVTPRPIPEIEGYDWGARWLSSRNECTKNDTTVYPGQVRLQNEGEQGFVVRTAELVDDAGGAFALDMSTPAETIVAGMTIAPNENGRRARLQRVTFAPTAERDYRGLFRVITDGDDTLDAILVGTGIESHIAVEPVAIDLGSYLFETPGAELARTTITIRALPTRALTVRELTLEGSSSIAIARSGGFIPPRPDDPTSWWRMAPGDSRIVPITYAPSDSGLATATLRASGDHARCDDSIATITAHSYRVELTLDASVESTTGCAEEGGIATLTNRSPVAFTLVSIRIVPPGAFAVEPMPTLPVRIAAGERLELPVTFHPSVPGAHAATLELEIRDSTGGEIRRLTTRLSASATAIIARAHIDTVHGLPGDRVEATIWLDDAIDRVGVTEIEVSVGIDPRVVALLDASLDGGLLDGWQASVLEHSDSLYRVRLSGARPLAGTGRLMRLVLRGHLGPVLNGALTLRAVAVGLPCVEIIGAPGLFRLDSICGMSLRQITLFEESYALREARPNPFNPSTTIPFSIGFDGPVRLEILDARGARVGLLADGSLAAGRYEVTWDASAVASGAYLVRMQAGEFSAVRPLLLVR
jgi:hypothetical protein